MLIPALAPCPRSGPTSLSLAQQRMFRLSALSPTRPTAAGKGAAAKSGQTERLLLELERLSESEVEGLLAQETKEGTR
jgi:hypothetical protein